MKLTGAAILVSRGMKVLQAAPAAYPYRSAAEDTVGDNSRLGYLRAGQVLVVRPLTRVLGPWDGADDPPAEAVEFRDQLQAILGVEAGPLLLDLHGFEFARNWNWWLVPLTRDCRAAGRPLAVYARSPVAEAIAATRLDRLLPTFTGFAEAVAVLSERGESA